MKYVADRILVDVHDGEFDCLVKEEEEVGQL